MTGLYILVLLLVHSVTSNKCFSDRVYNNRPVIGVLSQELSQSLEDIYGSDTYSSYIAASYVKFVEGGGAQAVPILINQNVSYYESLFSKLNGVLFPGGAVDLSTSGYGKAGKILFDLAEKANRVGDYFPVWGTCLGFELLAFLMAGSQEIRCDCESYDQALPLILLPGATKSHLFRRADPDVLWYGAHENITANYHHYCVTEKNITDFNLRKKMRTLALGTDENGLKFVAAFESRSKPYFGIQFHPEKNLYEWVSKKGIVHSHGATALGQYFADFLVDQARMSGHTFPTDELQQHVIYNYSPQYSGLQGSVYEQCYFF